MLDAKELLGLVTDDVVIKIMEENGAPLHHSSTDGSSGQKVLWFKTICHGGDSHKLEYFTESKDFYCYTSCGRMSFYELISRIRNATQKEFHTKVITYVASKVGVDPRGKAENDSMLFGSKVSRDRLREDSKSFEFKIENKAELEYFKENNWEITKFYDDSILNYFDKNTFYQGWIKEGIKIPSMEKYGISWYEFQKYIIIPHYNIDGKLVGIRRRSLKEEDSNNKYMPLFLEGKDYGHSLGLNLYGAYQNKEAIENFEEVVIVEGEKSVLQSDTFFGKYSTAVATCGFSVSSAQISLLKKMGVARVFLGFDKDYDENLEEEYKKDKDTYAGYVRYKEKIDSIARRLVTDFNVFILKDTEGLLGQKDSPFDKGKDTFLKLKKEAVKHSYKCDVSY